jgi:NitT/TauT family transport system permease protein
VFYTGKPSLMWQVTLSWIANGTLLRNVQVTLQEALTGFVLGSVGGMLLGLILGSSGVAREIFAPLVFATYAVPRLGLTPLFILWFGLGIGSKIALVTILVFYLTFFNTYQGAREVDRDLLASIRLMRASRWQIIQKVTLPSAAVWVAVGLKVSVPYAFVGAIVGEILAGNLGLGALISKAANQLDPNALFAATLITAALAIILNALVGRGVQRLLSWREVTRGTQVETL